MTHYHPRHYAKPRSPYVMARLFIVTSAIGVRFVERQSLNSPELGRLPQGRLFHGEPVGAWVRRLPHEGGGYAFSVAVKEVV